MSPYDAVATAPCFPTTRWPRHRVSLRRGVRHVLKPRSAVTETGPQPGISDITHTTVKPTPTPTCRTHHHDSRGEDKMRSWRVSRGLRRIRHVALRDDPDTAVRGFRKGDAHRHVL